MKIRKMENKELKKVTGQCCCKVEGRPAIYESDSCCLRDCNRIDKPSSYVSPLH